MLASWQKVWREGFAPQMPTAGLMALAQALRHDDPRLLQGATVQPLPLTCCRDWPVEGCCPVSFCGWEGEHLNTVERVVEFFARCCVETDKALGEPASCRYFLNWVDETPRAEMIPALLAEVEQELERRGAA
jgi:hypothetical protein